jgi:hypothetical protein
MQPLLPLPPFSQLFSTKPSNDDFLHWSLFSSLVSTMVRGSCDEITPPPHIPPPSDLIHSYLDPAFGQR